MIDPGTHRGSAQICLEHPLVPKNRQNFAQMTIRETSRNGQH